MPNKWEIGDSSAFFIYQQAEYAPTGVLVDGMPSDREDSDDAV